MATVNFSVPDNVKRAFDETFADRNKSAVVAELMREAVDRAQRKAASRAAIERLLRRRGRAPVRSEAQLRSSRGSGRP